jgi:hypothetical protein
MRWGWLLTLDKGNVGEGTLVAHATIPQETIEVLFPRGNWLVVGCRRRRRKRFRRADWANGGLVAQGGKRQAHVIEDFPTIRLPCRFGDMVLVENGHRCPKEVISSLLG